MKKSGLIIILIILIFLFTQLIAESVESLMLQAEQLEKEKNQKDALKLYEQILQLDPQNVKASRKIIILERMLAKDDPEYQAQDYLSIFRKANRLYDKGEYTAAVSEYEKALQKQPNSLEAMLGKAKSMYWTYERDESFELLHRLLENDENCLAALVQLAFFNYIGLNFQEAAKYYDQVLQFNDLSEFEQEDIYLNAGIVFSKIQALEKAHQTYEKGLAAFPENHNFAFYNGQLYFDEQNYDAALQWIQTAIELKNDDATNWYYKGLCHFFLKQYPEAKSALDQSLIFAPDYTDAKYFLAVTLILHYKNNEQALPYLNDFIARNPDHTEALFWRSSAYIGLQRFEEALTDVNKILSIDPLNSGAIQYKPLLERKLQ